MMGAKHSSKNRPRGTMGTKPILSFTTDVVRNMIIHKVYPAICKKITVNLKNLPIYVEQDNVKPHNAGSDSIFLNEGVQDGWNILTTNQPPNNPDSTVYMGKEKLRQEGKAHVSILSNPETMPHAHEVIDDQALMATVLSVNITTLSQCYFLLIFCVILKSY